MKYIVQSLPKKGKPKNGDSYHFFEDDAVLIAVVADGVGGNGFDWKASKQASEDLVYYYEKEFKALGVKEGIAQSLRKTYARIYWTRGECEGMLTTLIALIVDKKSNEYYYFGVGDSLILKYENEEITELTPECAFRIQPDLLPSRIRSGGQLNKNTAFALMSDGISFNRKAYKEEINGILNSESWDEPFTDFMKKNQLSQFDDMTLMLLKN